MAYRHDDRGDIVMSRYYKYENVINAIEDKIAEYIPTLYGRYEEIPLELRMAIESLPTIEVSDKADRPFEYFEGYEDGKASVEVSEDAISREVAMDIVVSSTAEEMVEKMRNAPSVIPQQKEGEWYRQTTDHFDYWECSECGMGVGLDDIKNYCPNCGAKMKGADDE